MSIKPILNNPDALDNKSLNLYSNSLNVNDLTVNGDIVSNKSYGEMSLLATFVTNIGASFQLYPVAGTFVAGTSNDFTTSSSPQQLIYNGTATKFFKVSATLSCSASSTISCVVALRKNDTFQSNTQKTITLVADQVNVIATSKIIELSEDDYIDVAIANNTDTTNISTYNLILDISEI